MKDVAYLQNMDNQAKVHDLPARLPVYVCTQTHRAQAGLEKHIARLVYKLCEHAQACAGGD